MSDESDRTRGRARARAALRSGPQVTRSRGGRWPRLATRSTTLASVGRVRQLTAVLLLALLAGCSAGGGDARAPSEGTPRSESPSSQSPDDLTSACVEVRAGISAFNTGDFEETVARFQDAVPLAKAEAEKADAGADSEAADLLLEAVEYYADLAPEDYVKSAANSPDFERYKQITLGQCLAGVPPASEEPPGVEV